MVTGGWQIQASSADRLVIAAYDHLLTIVPFVIEDHRIVPVPLKHKPASGVSSGVRTDGFRFPDEVRLFGCVVILEEGVMAAVESGLFCGYGDRTISISAAGGLGIRLFEQPSGELTELYDDDWRTVPLLASPVGTLWPGELARYAANPSPAKCVYAADSRHPNK